MHLLLCVEPGLTCQLRPENKKKNKIIVVETRSSHPFAVLSNTGIHLV